MSGTANIRASRQPVSPDSCGDSSTATQNNPGCFFGIKDVDVARMKGLILAGGKGTRLRPFDSQHPETSLFLSRNAPFLLYQIDLMRSAGN